MEPPKSGHALEEELEQYCLGDLTEPRLGRLEEHLLLCEACRERLTETENFVAAMRQAGRQLSAEGEGKRAAAAGAGASWRNSWPGRVAPALLAAALVVCAAVWFSHHFSAPAPMPFAVELAALRGGARGEAPADRPLLLKLDLTGLADDELLSGEVVDAAGTRVARFSAAAPRLQPLAPGGYFVRIYQRSGELLREYSLTVK